MRLRALPALLPLATVTTAALVAAVVAAPPASAAAVYAPADSATVAPGVQTLTEGAQCTSNFVFTQPTATGTRTFLGQAAHCAGTGGATETDGCLAASLPLGTKVEVDGAARPGTLAYSSWLAMQAAGEKDDETCAYNDFALVELAPARRRPHEPVRPRPRRPDRARRRHRGGRRGLQLRQLLAAPGRRQP